MAPERSSSQSLKSSALSPRRFSLFSGVLVALVLGAGVAVFGTLIHQTRLYEAPIGVVMALAICFWAALTLRQRAQKLSGWVFTGTLAALLTLIGQRANDVMIPATDLGYSWTYGAIAVAAVVTAFPKISRELWSKKL